MKKLFILLLFLSNFIGLTKGQNIQSKTKSLETWDQFRFDRRIYDSFKTNMAYSDVTQAALNSENVLILDLSHQNLTSLPPEISQFKNLEDLSLTGNMISNWEITFDLLSKLPKLRKLMLVKCGIKTIPDNISQLLNLDVLELSYNELDSIPSVTSNLINLEYLRLYNNKALSHITKDIGKLKKLQILDIAGTNVEILPNELADCESLINITANAAKLKEIPNNIGNLKNLRTINFSYNKIESIPSSLSECTELLNIGLGGNKIKSVPEGFGKLDKAYMCDLSRNALTEFSSELTKLEAVQNLWLHQNDISSIPTEIFNLTKLTHLLIDSNEIKNLEQIKFLMPNLRIIDQK